MSPTTQTPYRRSPKLEKKYKLDTSEWRYKAYSKFHRTLDRSLLVLDVDTVEWRKRGEMLIPVAVIELTGASLERPVTASYLDAVIDRFHNYGMQAHATKLVARRLRCPAFLVVYREDCSDFWVINLNRMDDGWTGLSALEYEQFLEEL